MPIDKERYATNEKGNTIYWSGGSKDGQKVTKDERIKWLGDQLKESEEANNALCERLKDLRELIFAACSLNFKFKAVYQGLEGFLAKGDEC